METDKNVQLKMSKTLHMRLKSLCAMRYKTISEVLRELVIRWVKENEDKQKEKDESV
jgi:hypothetical protein